MFSTSNSCKVMAACVLATMMVMMMMVEVTAMPRGGSHVKHPTNRHRKSFEDIETVPLELDPKALIITRNIRPLENASISPWTYNVSHDASLYPPVLSEARCLLRGCLDKEGMEDQSLQSRPILHRVLLLRRVTGTGSNYHYRLESRVIAVGCTCIRPIIQHQH